MAAVAGTVSAHATLTTTTADTVTLSGSGKSLIVTNHHASELLYFRCDGTTAVAAADDTYVVRPASSKTLEGSKFGGNMSMSVVGNGNAYGVEIF